MDHSPLYYRCVHLESGRLRVSRSGDVWLLGNHQLRCGSAGNDPADVAIDAAICHELEKVARGETKRLIITMPPRYLKSICASVAFPAWVLGHDPTRKIICVSYAQELATKHGNDCRAILNSDWYPGVFPNTKIDSSKNTEIEFMTTERGFRLSTSVGHH